MSIARDFIYVVVDTNAQSCGEKSRLWHFRYQRQLHWTAFVSVLQMEMTTVCNRPHSSNSASSILTRHFFALPCSLSFLHELVSIRPSIGEHPCISKLQSGFLAITVYPRGTRLHTTCTAPRLWTLPHIPAVRLRFDTRSAATGSSIDAATCLRGLGEPGLVRGFRVGV